MNNNNEQVNSSRETVNGNISRYYLLGQSRREIWTKRRKYRTI